MKHILFAVLFFLTASLLTCCKKNEIVAPSQNLIKLHWATPLNFQTDAYKEVSVTEEYIYDNGIVVGDYNNGKRGLRMIDLNTKETRWTWTEDIPLKFKLHRDYQFENYLVTGTFDKVYCIDLNDGKTKFIKNIDFSCDNWVSGLGNTFFLSDYKEKSESSIYRGSILTENIEKYLVPNFEREYSLDQWAAVSRLMYKATATVYQGDTLLNVLYVEPNPPHEMFPKMGLYNMSKKKWLYENIHVVKPATGYNTMPNGAKIIGEKMYLASGNDLICYELLTGKEIWRRNDFTHAFAFAFRGFEIFEDKVITCTEEGKLYCINAETGQNSWVLDKISSGSSYVRYHNGVIYFLGKKGLMAADIKNGEILASAIPGGWMQDRLVIAPQSNGEKAKVIVFTYENMYVYEAIQ